MDLLNSSPQDLLSDKPEWLAVLTAYLKREETAVEATKRLKAEAPEPVTDDDAASQIPRSTTHWLTRLNELEGVPSEHLAPIHGKLITLGLLKFNLQGRERGIEYTLSGEARRLVKQLVQSSSDAQGDEVLEESVAA